MTANYIPVRKLHPNNSITTRLLNADGTEPPAGTPELSAAQYPATNLTERRYKLDIENLRRRVGPNLLWLSENNPLLFEELLQFLEALDEEHAPAINVLLDHELTLTRHASKSYICAYYRLAIDTKPMLIELAAEGFPGSPKRRAWGLFVSARTSCGYTVEHPHFTAALIAVWIMQDKHDPLRNPIYAKDHEEDLAFITERFDEIFNNRSELRARATIDKSIIQELLEHYAPLREGAL